MTGKLLADRYRIIQVTASTVSGTTYLASDTYRPGYPHCVLKQLQPLSDRPKTLQMVKLLLQEKIETRKKLGKNHQIPEILDFFEDNQQLYLVEEYVSGHPLSQEILPGHPLSEAQVVQLLQEVLPILVFVHGQGVVHYDIQPANLVRRQTDGQIVLTNFRLLREISTPGIETERRSPRALEMTVSAYSPPEQLQGQPNPSSDLYALGMIGIQALTGASAENLLKLTQLNGSSGELLWRHKASVRPEVADILDGMVQPDFTQRYQSAAEVLRHLQQVSPPSTALPLSQPPASQATRHSSAQKSSAPNASTPQVLPQASPQPLAPLTVVHPQAVETYRDRTSVSIERISPSDRSSLHAKAHRRTWLWAIAVLLILGGVGYFVGSGRSSQIWAHYLLQRGINKSDNEDYAGAIAQYNQVIEVTPNNSEAYYQRGFAHYRAKQEQLALQDLTQAIQLDPNHAKAHFYRGNLRLGLGDRQGALADYNHVTQLDPNFAPAYLNRGNVQADLGDEPAAIIDYSRAIQIDPTLASAYLNRCLTRSNLQDQTGAIEDCTQAISLNPNYAFAYQNRGLAHRRQGDLQRAIEDFNVAIRLSPEDADPYYNRGLARLDLGDRSGAVEDFNIAIQLNPSHALVYYDRGVALAKLGDRQQAIRDFEQSAKLCLEEGRTGCYQDAQYQLKQLR